MRRKTCKANRLQTQIMSKKEEERRMKPPSLGWGTFYWFNSFSSFHASQTLIPCNYLRSPPVALEAEDIQQRGFRQTQAFFFFIPLQEKRVFRWQLPSIYFFTKSEWNQTCRLNAIYDRFRKWLTDYEAVRIWRPGSLLLASRLLSVFQPVYVSLHSLFFLSDL